jgi:hypothetical protein
VYKSLFEGSFGSASVLCIVARAVWRYWINVRLFFPVIVVQCVKWNG